MPHSAEEVPVSIPPAEDEEPTKPNSVAKALGGLARESSLTVRNLTKVEAAQLAAIVAGWEKADGSNRALIEEFAKRVGRSRESQPSKGVSQTMPAAGAPLPAAGTPARSTRKGY